MGMLTTAMELRLFVRMTILSSSVAHTRHLGIPVLVNLRKQGKEED